MRHGKRMRDIALLAGALLMATAMVACGDDSGSTTSAGTAGTTTPAEPTQFTVLVGNPAAYPFFEAYVAVSEGFFADRGLDVEVVPVDGTEGLIQGFAAGLGDIVFGDLGSYLRPTATDQFHPVAFYMATNSGVFEIVVPGDSDIQAGADLDGKVIGINSDDDPGPALVRNLNSTLGINTETLLVGTHLQALTAFDRGEIDAYAGSLPDIAVLQARGVDLRGVAPVEIRAANGGSGFWSTRELMDEKPEAFKAFVAAVQAARAFINDDAQNLVDWANAQEPIPEDEMAFNLSLAAALIGLRPTDVEPVGYIDPATWQMWWDGLVANEVVDATIGESTDFYTNEFQG